MFAIRAACALTVAASAFLCEAATPAPRGHTGAGKGSGFALYGSPGVGDFDGDNLVDIAYAKPQGRVNGTYRYQVEVRLTAESAVSFNVASGAAGGLHISTRDIDGDHDLDLVITSAFGGDRVGVWINDGHGRFTQGVAESYPLSIWQEPDRLWETPERSYPPAPAFLIPAGNPTIEPARFELSAPAGAEQPLPAGGGIYRPEALNSGSPFRAPPLS